MSKYEARVVKNGGNLAIQFKDDEPLKQLKIKKGDDVKVSVEYDRLVIEKKGWF